MQDGNGNSALHLACWAPVVNPKLSMSSRMPGMSPMDDAREAVPTVTFTQAARRPDMRAPIGITAAALLVALVMISADVVEVSNNLA